MSAGEMVCTESERRQRIREANEGELKWNGIDYIEVEEAASIVIHVHFFCDLPQVINEDQVKLITEIRDETGTCVDIGSATIEPAAGKELTIRLSGNAAKTLTSSPYSITFRLCPDDNRPLGHIDQRYATGTFQYFDPSKQVEIDPRPVEACPARGSTDEPAIDYTARDFQSFRQLIADRLALTMPQWRETHVPDIGVAVTEVMAYVADHLSQFQDAVATEAYLSTARSRISARRHARLIDYEVDEGSNVRTFVHLQVARDVEITPEDMYFITKPPGESVFDETNLPQTSLDGIPRSAYQAFEAVVEETGKEEEYTLPELRNPLQLLIMIRYVPCPGDEDWSALIECMREYLKPALDAVLPAEDGLEATWQRARSLASLTAPQLHLVLEGLNRVIRHTKLLRKVDPKRLSEWAREQLACCHPRQKWDQVNRIILDDLFPQQLAPKQRMQAPKLKLYEHHNRIEFYTWNQSDCCLPQGATSVTLQDRWLKPSEPGYAEQGRWRSKNTDCQDDAPRALRICPGDLLLLEEVLDPGTGVELDADPTHRQIVRVCHAKSTVDRLHNIPVVEVTWHEEDALRFPLCLSSHTKSPPCKPLGNVSVARGNIIPVDHGETIRDEWIGSVTPQKTLPDCRNDLILNPQPLCIDRFRPKLENVGLTFSHTPQVGDSVTSWLSPRLDAKPKPSVRLLGIPSDPNTGRPVLQPDQLRNPNRCGPCIAVLNDGASRRLQNALSPSLGQFLVALQRRAQCSSSNAIRLWGRYLCLELQKELGWQPQIDLMTSTASDRHFVVEIDNHGVANLRFGNGLGKQPEPGTHFYATYRIGGGDEGNVGADSIQHVVFRRGMHSTILRVRNPLAPTSGRDGESLDHIKLHAPHATRELDRAIVADDYVTIALREFRGRLQGARCTITNFVFFQLALVTIDPLAKENVETLQIEVKQKLEQYRRAGHLLSVTKPTYVGVEIEMMVWLDRGQVPSQVRRELLQRFGKGMLPSGEPAFFHPDRYTFGDKIYKSRVVAAAMEVEGVRNVVIAKFQSVQSGQPAGIATPPAEPCQAEDADVECLEFGAGEIPQLLNDATRPDGGKLSIEFCRTDDT